MEDELWLHVACVAGGMRERATLHQPRSQGSRPSQFQREKPLGTRLTLHQSSHDFATRVHGFAAKTKALAHEIPPATQAIWWVAYVWESL